MRQTIRSGILLASALIPCAPSPCAPPDPADLDAAVDRAIDAGTTYLMRSWQGGAPARDGVGAQETLELLALLKCGGNPQEPPLEGAIRQVASQSSSPSDVYTAGVCLLLLGACHDPSLLPAMEQYARRLLDTQKPDGTWDYGRPSQPDAIAGAPGEPPDHSNTQIALLGLWAAARAGVEIPRPVWQRSLRHFGAVQAPGGGWTYAADAPATDDNATGSMTCAGICCVALCRAGMAGPEARGARGDAGAESRRGLAWLQERFTVRENPGAPAWHYYYLYSLERTGALTGRDRFGTHDWYREGAQYLVERQAADGAWRSGQPGTTERLDTCFALLFLRRATQPLYEVGGAAPTGR